jgi:hypothetical protein
MNSTSRSAEVREDRGEVARLLDARARRRADGHAELVGDDVGERRLAEAGRAVEQHVVERLAALRRGLDRDLQVLAHAVLPDVVVERARPQPGLVLRVVVDARGGDEPTSDIVVGFTGQLRSGGAQRRFERRAGSCLQDGVDGLLDRGRW